LTIVAEAKLQKQGREHVEVGAGLYSDELKSYDGLSAEYDHAVINHAVEYVSGSVHTNGMENFWSLLKRGLHRTYVSVEPFHLFRYIDEQVFRYNHRKNMNDADTFRSRSIANHRKATHLRGGDWQGGRNGVVIHFEKSAGAKNGQSAI
jgi:hypothetical protein